MPDVVTKADCDKKHAELDDDVEKAITTATKSAVSHIKIWILGTVAGLVLAGGGGFVCAMTEVGQYKERIDATSQRLEELDRRNTRQFEDIKQEIREVRSILLDRRQP